MSERPARGPPTEQGLPDGSQVAIVVHDVEVRHAAVALLFPGLIFHLLQGYPLGECINAQDLRGLQRQYKMTAEKLQDRPWKEVRQSRGDLNVNPPRK